MNKQHTIFILMS